MKREEAKANHAPEYTAHGPPKATHHCCKRRLLPGQANIVSSALLQRKLVTLHHPQKAAGKQLNALFVPFRRPSVLKESGVEGLPVFSPPIVLPRLVRLVAVKVHQRPAPFLRQQKGLSVLERHNDAGVGLIFKPVAHHSHHPLLGVVLCVHSSCRQPFRPKR